MLKTVWRIVKNFEETDSVKRSSKSGRTSDEKSLDVIQMFVESSASIRKAALQPSIKIAKGLDRKQLGVITGVITDHYGL